MKKKGKSVTGRLFYTFGTVFFAAIFAVCAMNFAKDGRAFQMPLLSAALGASANQGTTVAAAASNEYETIKINKSVPKTSSKSSSNTKSSSGSKPSQDKGAATSGTKAQPPAAVDP